MSKKEYIINEHGVITNPDSFFLAGSDGDYKNGFVKIKYAEWKGELHASLSMGGHDKGSGSGVSPKWDRVIKSIEEFALERKEEIIEYFSEKTQDRKTLGQIKKYYAQVEFKNKQPSLF